MSRSEPNSNNISGSDSDHNSSKQTHSSASSRDITVMGKLLTELLKKAGEQTSTSRKEKALDRVSKHNPPTYDGKMDSKELEGWIRRFEKLFDAADVPEKKKVSIATYYLSDLADTWWSTEESRSKSPDFTWETFKKLLREKFYPTSLKIQKQQEFFNLEQGDMSVVEYAAKFQELGRFAADDITTDSTRKNLFEKGLNQRIKYQLAGHCIETYQELYDRAANVERVMGFHKGDDVDSLKRKGEFKGSNWHGKKPFYGGTSQQGSQQGGKQSSRQSCGRCGRSNHTTRDCKVGTNLCNWCGKPGHIARECFTRTKNLGQSFAGRPSMSSNSRTNPSVNFQGRSSQYRQSWKPQPSHQQSQPQPPQPNASGRVYVVNKRDADAAD